MSTQLDVLFFYSSFLLLVLVVVVVVLVSSTLKPQHNWNSDGKTGEMSTPEFPSFTKKTKTQPKH